MADSDAAPSVTIVSQVFHPDTSANAGVLTELATGLADRGYDVSVLTTQPSYTEEDRQTTQPKSETYEGVSIRRLPATRFDRNRGTAYRMLNEISFFVAVLGYLLLRRKHGSEPLLLPTAPTFLPVLSWILRPDGYPTVPVVMDLYPDMAVQLGYLSEGGIVYRIWDWLNRRAYPSATHVVTIGETMEETLHHKYGRSFDVTVVHNWADGESIQPQERADNPFVQEHGLLDELTVLYSGNLGQHHDLDSVIEAATMLEREELTPPPHFLLIGEGGKKEHLERVATDRELESVTFLPYQPVEVLPDSLTAGDVAIVTMEQCVEGLCVSSKFYTALASGSAVLAISSEDAEIGSVVERTGCGIRVDPNDPEAVADAIRRWTENPAEVDEMGERARWVFEEEFSKPVALDKYESVLSVIASKRCRKP